MSNLVDTWTAELAKLRDKGRAALSGSSTPRAEAEAERASEPDGRPLSQAIRTKPRSVRLPCTEVAVAMLVDCSRTKKISPWNNTDVENVRGRRLIGKKGPSKPSIPS
ncbi:hypothetical protein C4D60_Mb04t07120 [Musa balbisiana]|uniref:Uncharacterized protein n=1 Tax=Musa balbisiana TaxID=52838 RepID=A0A4S8KA84_MUSBA|nr:hypothetical protein C4D60_Mb04t07120 [Musa balbisiana]